MRQHDPLLRRFVVETTPGLLSSPAAAFGNGAVRLDRRFLESPQPGYDDNRLVVVLYHEVGPLHYFSQVPPGPRSSQASERAAFDYSLLKTKGLAEAGDCLPLQTGLRYMMLRSLSNDLADPHVQALKTLVQESAYAEYEAYVASHCPAQPRGPADNQARFFASLRPTILPAALWILPKTSFWKTAACACARSTPPILKS